MNPTNSPRNPGKNGNFGFGFSGIPRTGLDGSGYMPYAETEYLSVYEEKVFAVQDQREYEFKSLLD